MVIILYSMQLLVYGYFCDAFVKLCTVYADKLLRSGLGLNKKLLILMSNFSDNLLSRWQKMEKRYIRLCLKRGFFWL